MQPRLPIEQLAHGLIDVLFLHFAALDRPYHALNHGGGVLRLQQQIVAGLERLDAHFDRTEAIDHVVVPEVVRREQAAKSQTIAQPIRRQLALDAGRQVGAAGERRHDEMLRHDERNTGVDRLLEGRQVLMFERVRGLLNRRISGDGRPSRRGAAAGKMFGGGEHAAVHITADIRACQASEQIHVRAERADAFGGVLRLGSQVDDRRVGEAEAHGAPFSGADRSRAIYQVLLAYGGKSHVPRKFRGAGDLLSRDRPRNRRR